MALQPHEQMQAWLKFAALCRKAGQLELCRLSLSKLLPPDASASTLPVHQLAASSFEGLLSCTPELLYAYAKCAGVFPPRPAISTCSRCFQVFVGLWRAARCYRIAAAVVASPRRKGDFTLLTLE